MVEECGGFADKEEEEREERELREEGEKRESNRGSGRVVGWTTDRVSLDRFRLS